MDYNETLAKCHQGDAAAREMLFGQLRVRLRLVAKYRLRGWPVQDLDDIVHDTLVVVAEKLERIESNPERFALDVLRKKIGNRLSGRQRKSEISLGNSSGEFSETVQEANLAAFNDQDDSVARLESEDLAAIIRRAIHRLSPLCQMLFVALLNNLSVTETWDLMRSAQGNLRRSAFDKRLFDCRKKLRQLLANNL